MRRERERIALRGRCCEGVSRMCPKSTLQRVRARVSVPYFADIVPRLVVEPKNRVLPSTPLLGMDYLDSLFSSRLVIEDKNVAALISLVVN